MNIDVRVIDRGGHNKVIGLPPSIQDAGRRDGSLVVEFNGDNCTLEIGPNVVFRKQNLIAFHRDNQSVTIAGDNRLTMKAHLKGNNSRISIGRGTNNNGMFWMSLGEANDCVTIGEHCLFASVRFRTSDSHPIYDIATGERVNRSGPIVIGDRVWLAEGVKLLRGANIGSGSIIGMDAMVNGVIPPNSLAVGIPARVVRENVRWQERFLPEQSGQVEDDDQDED